MNVRYKILFIRIYGIFILLCSLGCMIQTFNFQEELPIYMRVIFLIIGTSGLFISVNLLRLKEFAHRGIIILLSTYLVFALLGPIGFGILSLKFERYTREWQQIMLAFITSLVGFVGVLIFYVASLYFFTRKSIKEQFK